MTESERLDALEPKVANLQGEHTVLKEAVSQHGQYVSRHSEALAQHELAIAALQQAEAQEPVARWKRFREALAVKVGPIVSPILSAAGAVLTKFGPIAGAVLLTLALTGNLMIPGCPGPTPPGPTPTPVPPVPPVPPTPPAPIPLAGFRVLVVYDASTLADSQQGIVFGRAVRDYLNAKCAVGPDNKTKDYWILQAGTDVSAAPQWVQDAFQRHPGQKTWMAVSDGKTGYDGVLPGNVADAMAIFTKYGG